MVKSSIKRSRRNLRWMDYARRSMQRPGFLKWVLSLASASRSQSLEALTRAFFLSVTKPFQVPDESRDIFQKYVRQFRKDLNKPQIQDRYLSDPALPSHTGPITGDLERKGYRHSVYVEIPTWATRLQLLREKNYTLTDRGRVLLLHCDAAKIAQALEVVNPLMLNTSERHVLLYCLIDADGE